MPRVAQRPTEKARAHLEEPRRGVGHQVVVGRRVLGLGEAPLVQHLGHPLGSCIRRVDQRDAGPSDARDDLGQQRVVGATQYQGVDVVEQPLPQVPLRDEVRHLALSPTFFSQRHEQRAGLRTNDDARPRVLQRSLVGARGDGAGGADDRHPARLRRQRRGLCAWRDDAHDRYGQVIAQRGQRHRRGGVAGHDQQLQVELHQGVGVGQRILGDHRA